MSRHDDLPLANRPLADLPGHWLLARLGKRVLRPGGLQLTTRLLAAARIDGAAEEREMRALRIGADLAHRVRVARARDEQSIADLVVAVLGELGFEVRSVLDCFGAVTVQICTCPLAEVAVSAPEVVRGIQQGLIQEVVDLNAATIGGDYSVTVQPDAHEGSCEVALVLRPL